ncbi:hypothetical protein [Flavobacterium sp. ACN6]|uniref:hypothetical protein n=1 Tax=Flavobacterium sp. ACN6 TaxID=1920426 RepID=UPI000BB2FAD3|nr:hypothetical protein [Flavobacterium sp. ACN6]PBJ08082.1 hypothetical protein BSF42_37990 [Flavobacterium sp. ACN6]
MDVSFFSSTIVQIAVSIVISWALFALLSSMILEITVQIKSERGRFFRNKMLEKLYDSSNNVNWGVEIYLSSAVKLLTKSDKAPPAEISSKTLAEALIDAVANLEASKMLKKKEGGPDGYEEVKDYKNVLLNNVEFSIKYLGQSDVIVMLKNAVSKAKVKAALGDFYDEKILYEELVGEITAWFDQFSERTSSWYKKLSRKRLFLIGLLVSAAANIDSIDLYKYYEGNPAARAGMVEYYLEHKAQLETLAVKYDAAKPAIPAADQVSVNVIEKDIENLNKQIDSLKTTLKLPLGWDNPVWIKTDNMCKCKNGVTVREQPKEFFLYNVDFSCVLMKMLGIIISAFAASLGAPFWFDLLKKATSVTQTVIKQN